MNLIERLRRLAEGPRDHAVLPLSPANKAVRLTWLPPDDDAVWDDYPELEDVIDELAGYRPLATVELGEGVFRCVVVAREAPHAVSLFYDGFQRVAPSLDAFAASLLTADEQPPAALLEAAVDAARARIDARDHAGAVSLLSPALQRHPRTPGEHPDRGLRDLLRAGWTELGVAHHELGDDLAAAEAYRVAVAWGSKAACNNLLALAMDAKHWSEARVLLDEMAGFYLPPDELNALRVKSAHVLAELGERDIALALAVKHAEYLRETARSKHALGAGLQRSFLTALDALSPGAAGQAILADVRNAISAPLPEPPAPAQVSSGDIATAVRLIGAGKVMQLRSLLTRIPALAADPALAAAVEKLPSHPDKTVMQQLLLERSA